MNQEKPVMLVHGYGYSNADRKSHPAQASLHPFDYLQVAATAKLWEAGKISRIVLAAGALDKGNPTVAFLVYQQLKDQRIPADAIELAPFGKSTRGEVKVFKSLCIENDWQNVIFLSIKDHRYRVRKAVYRLISHPDTVSFINAEDVLQAQGEPYRTFIDSLHKSELFESFRKMEGIKQKIDLYFDGSLLDLRDIFLPYKGVVQNIVMGLSKH